MLISPIIRDQVMCDLGCGDGRFLRMCSKYARKVIGVDRDEYAVKMAKAGGIEVYHSDVKDFVPPADVYYVFSMSSDNNKEIVSHVRGKRVIVRKCSDDEKYDNERYIGMDLVEVTNA